MTARVLVTGAGGYVGGRLVQLLAAMPGIHVRATSRGRPRREWGPDVEFVGVDPQLSTRSLAAACDGVSHVVHLASPNEQEAVVDPLAAVDVTVGGTVRTLDAAHASGVQRFVYVSTAHVYGAPLAGRITEDLPTWPVHPYAITHRAAEDFALAAARRGLTCAVIRLSNAVGAPITSDVNRWTLVANDLCRQVAQSGCIRLQSSGLQYRDFIPMIDACRAMHHLLMLPATALGAGVFNVGGRRSLRVRDLASLIAQRYARLTGMTPTLEIPDPKPDEHYEMLDYRIDRLVASGFRLEGSLEEEIDSTLRVCDGAVRTAS